MFTPVYALLVYSLGCDDRHCGDCGTTPESCTGNCIDGYVDASGDNVVFLCKAGKFVCIARG